jgi:hypothetical protein
MVLKMDDKKNIIFINVLGYLLLSFLIIYIGQREITSHFGFGDTVNYYRAFTNYQLGSPIADAGDYGWNLFMKLMSSMVSIHTFFTICAFLYIFPLYKVSKNLFKEYWYYAFVLFIVSYSFWTYGVNGVRNGVALSLFLWGFSYRNNKVIMGIFFFLAVMFHKTTMLPILAYLLTYFYNNPKVFLKAWVLCIPLSLLMGGFWVSLITGLGFGDDRLSEYLTTQESELSVVSGFRWDFLFYSSFAVVAGWYFIIKKGFEDQLYFQLFNTYLICNGFWILIINANYSNRFAYLSWFMMAIIIIYPLLKQRFFKNQHLMIGKITFLYFGFTYFMNYVYYEYIR